MKTSNSRTISTHLLLLAVLLATTTSAAPTALQTGTPFLLATLLPSSTIATSRGANGCIGGQAAPTGHGGKSSGSLEDGGFILTAEASTGDEYVVTLSGPEFKGYLFRTELGTDIVDAGIGQEAAVCEGVAVGVTHVSPDWKTEATAIFMAPAGSAVATIDVSVVKSFTDYYYSAITVDLVAVAEDADMPAVFQLDTGTDYENPPTMFDYIVNFARVPFDLTMQGLSAVDGLFNVLGSIVESFASIAEALGFGGGGGRL